MADDGRKFVIYRLTACATREGLRKVWESLGREYQSDPKIKALKDEMKARL